MAIMGRLRSFVPVGGSIIWEPSSGDEGDLRPVLGFTPQWYHKYAAVSLGESWHRDPLYRYESLVKMKTFLSRQFPGYGQFRLDFNEKGIEESCATISAAYGIMAVPLAYGIPVIYGEDHWPEAKPGVYLSKEEIVKLKSFTPDDNPFLTELLSQIETLYRTFGVARGSVNYQGILNIATKVYGQDIFYEFYDDPEFAAFLLEHIAGTMCMMAKAVQAKQRELGWDTDQFVVSNCTMNMISPDLYEKFILPLDMKISGQFNLFGMHTCNWDVTKYIPSIQKFIKMEYLDMGMVSDMKRVRDCFPSTRRAVIYSPGKLLTMSREELREEIKEIYESCGPCDLILSGIDPNTTVDDVKAFLGIVKGLGV